MNAKYKAGDVINGCELLFRLPNRRWLARCQCGAEFVVNPTATNGKCKACDGLTETQEQIIVALCDNRLNMSEVGRKLYLTQSAVQSQCNSIKKKTGLDPRDFWDMQKLLELMKGKRNE